MENPTLPVDVSRKNNNCYLHNSPRREAHSQTHKRSVEHLPPHSAKCYSSLSCGATPGLAADKRRA